MWNPGGWSGIPVHQDMSGSRILPRRSSSTFGVWKGAVYNMPQSNVRKEPPPACHRQGEVVLYVCIRPPHPFPSTSAAWIRRREGITKSTTPWKETPAQFAERMRSICSHINPNWDVDGLCRALPKRVQAGIDAKADRINR